jgi:hypothetical protein
MIGRITPVFQDVARLAIERLADPLQRLETHAPDLAGLQERDVLFGDADALGQFLGAHLARGQHDVEVDYDGHLLSRDLAVLARDLRGFSQHVRYGEQQAGEGRSEVVAGRQRQGQVP